MPKSLRKLTNLEAAILAEIEHQGKQTAFKVRQAFAASFSLEWKGSAGAVYPAVHRLELAGLIVASEPVDARKTRRLSLSKLGRRSLEVWVLDSTAASSIGVDPFRLRAGIWSQMPKDAQHQLLVKLERQIESEIHELTMCLQTLDPIGAIGVSLACQVQAARLEQTKAWKHRGFHFSNTKTDGGDA